MRHCALDRPLVYQREAAVQPAQYQRNFKKWHELSDEERKFFTGEEYLPLPAAHAERMAVLSGKEAREFLRESLYGIPGYSVAATTVFPRTKSISLTDVWNDAAKIQMVREWLHHCGIGYSDRVYLLYRDVVVATDWKMVVNYWDALAWNVGVEMVALDESKSWVCSFHHEEVITFSSYQ